MNTAKASEAELKAAGLRVTGDYRPEKIGAKIRDGSREKVPVLVGRRPRKIGITNTVSLRDESEAIQKDRDKGPRPLAEVLQLLQAEIAAKTIRNISTATANIEGEATGFEG